MKLLSFVRPVLFALAAPALAACGAPPDEARATSAQASTTPAEGEWVGTDSRALRLLYGRNGVLDMQRDRAVEVVGGGPITALVSEPRYEHEQVVVKTGSQLTEELRRTGALANTIGARALPSTDDVAGANNPCGRTPTTTSSTRKIFGFVVKSKPDVTRLFCDNRQSVHLLMRASGTYDVTTPANVHATDEAARCLGADKGECDFLDAYGARWTKGIRYRTQLWVLARIESRDAYKLDEVVRKSSSGFSLGPVGFKKKSTTILRSLAQDKELSISLSVATRGFVPRDPGLNLVDAVTGTDSLAKLDKLEDEMLEFFHADLCRDGGLAPGVTCTANAVGHAGNASRNAHPVAALEARYDTLAGVPESGKAVLADADATLARTATYLDRYGALAAQMERYYGDELEPLLAAADADKWRWHMAAPSVSAATLPLHSPDIARAARGFAAQLRPADAFSEDGTALKDVRSAMQAALDNAGVGDFGACGTADAEAPYARGQAALRDYEARGRFWRVSFVQLQLPAEQKWTAAVKACPAGSRLPTFDEMVRLGPALAEGGIKGQRAWFRDAARCGGGATSLVNAPASTSSPEASVVCGSTDARPVLCVADAGVWDRTTISP